MSTANWAGYSPNALQWENDANKREIVINKVKDLIPEECEVKWDHVPGYAPPGHVKPKMKVYGGIRQIGQPYPIPVENSYWYPLLMESGDYYGRKLLRPSFTSWFFSILIHLFANRYYKRFGEPTPIGRAPFDEDITINGTTKSGQSYMLDLLQNLRNRSVVVLPNDSFQDTHGRLNYDYQIDYLESQMRGADFQSYMTRLDEEISIGLFTPILLLRTSRRWLLQPRRWSHADVPLDAERDERRPRSVYQQVHPAKDGRLQLLREGPRRKDHLPKDGQPER